MKKLFVFAALFFFILSESCNKNVTNDHITEPIIAGTVSKRNFVYKQFSPAAFIKTFKDTGTYPILYTDTHLPNLLLVKYEPDFDNVVTFSADHTVESGSKYYTNSKFSVVTVSGSSNLQLCPKPLQEGDSIEG